MSRFDQPSAESSDKPINPAEFAATKQNANETLKSALAEQREVAGRPEVQAALSKIKQLLSDAEHGAHFAQLLLDAESGKGKGWEGLSEELAQHGIEIDAKTLDLATQDSEGGELIAKALRSQME